MKTREEVEKLKSDWEKGQDFDLLNQEGFEEYYEELTQYKADFEKKQSERAYMKEILKNHKRHRLSTKHRNK